MVCGGIPGFGGTSCDHCIRCIAELRKDAESRLSLMEICSGASSNLEREELLEARIHDLEGKVVEAAPCMQDEAIRFDAVSLVPS